MKLLPVVLTLLLFFVIGLICLKIGNSAIQKNEDRSMRLEQLRQEYFGKVERDIDKRRSHVLGY